MTQIQQFVISAAISGCGLLCSSAYLLRELARPRGLRPWWFRLDTVEGALRRKQRRQLGMALVALLSVFFFVGINFINPIVAPVAYLSFWFVISLLLLWLCLLAFNDLLHTRRILRRLRGEVRARLADTLRNGMSASPTASE